MRVAAIYDIHENLSALEAVLKDIRQAVENDQYPESHVYINAQRAQ